MGVGDDALGQRAQRDDDWRFPAPFQNGQSLLPGWSPPTGECGPVLSVILFSKQARKPNS